MTDRTMLARHYVEVLTQRLGLPAHIDDDGDIVFVSDSMTFVIPNTAPHDPEYFRVVTGLRVDTELDALTQLLVAHHVTWKRKFVFVFPEDGAVQISSDMVLAPRGMIPEASLVAAVVPRPVEALLTGLQAYLAGLDKKAVAASAPSSDPRP